MKQDEISEKVERKQQQVLDVTIADIKQFRNACLSVNSTVPMKAKLSQLRRIIFNLIDETKVLNSKLLVTYKSFLSNVWLTKSKNANNPRKLKNVLANTGLQMCSGYQQEVRYLLENHSILQNS